MLKHQKISICLHSKQTAVSWPIKFWRLLDLGSDYSAAFVGQNQAQSPCKPVDLADLPNKPLFSRSSGGFPLGPKARVYPLLYYHGKELVRMVERNRRGLGRDCNHFGTCLCRYSELQRSVFQG